MDEKNDLPTKRGEFPELQPDTRKQINYPKSITSNGMNISKSRIKNNPDETFALNISNTNDEVTLFNADIRSSCNVTNSSFTEEITNSIIQQNEKRKYQQEIGMLLCKLQKKKCKINRLKAEHYAEIVKLKKQLAENNILEVLKIIYSKLKNSNIHNSPVIESMKLLEFTLNRAENVPTFSEATTRRDTIISHMGKNTRNTSASNTTVRISSQNPSFQLNLQKQENSTKTQRISRNNKTLTTTTTMKRGNINKSNMSDENNMNNTNICPASLKIKSLDKTNSKILNRTCKSTEKVSQKTKKPFISSIKTASKNIQNSPSQMMLNTKNIKENEEFIQKNKKSATTKKVLGITHI